MSQRPTGVTILAVLQLLNSALGLLLSLGVLLLGGLVISGMGAENSGEAVAIGGVLLFLAIFFLIFSLIGLIMGYGLWTLRAWAWLGTLIFQGIGILAHIVTLFAGDLSGGSVMGLVISGVIINYLLQPNVKRAFGQ